MNVIRKKVIDVELSIDETRELLKEFLLRNGIIIHDEVLKQIGENVSYKIEWSASTCITKQQEPAIYIKIIESKLTKE